MSKKKKSQKIHQINHLNLQKKIWLKYIMTHVDHITLIVTLNLKLKC